MPISYSFYLSLASFGFGTIFILLFARWQVVARWASLFWGVLGSALLVVLSYQLFTSAGTSLDFQLIEGVRTITTAIHLDVFTAFFLLMIGIVGTGFFSFWSQGDGDEAWTRHAFSQVIFGLLVLLVSSSNVLFFLFCFQCLGICGLILMLLVPGLNRRLVLSYVVAFELATMFFTVMWMILSASAQNLYFGALVQGAGQLGNGITVVITVALVFGLLALAWGTKKVTMTVTAYPAGMYQALMLIVSSYLFLRVELFFLPAVSLWMDIGFSALGFLILLGSSLYNWFAKKSLTLWSGALGLFLIIAGVLLWAVQGNVAAMISIWSAALFWGMLVLVTGIAACFWARQYYLANIASLVIVGGGIFTTLWLYFQGLWQAMVYVNNPLWRLTMLITIIASVLIGGLWLITLNYRSSAVEKGLLTWKQLGLLIWLAGLTVAVVGAGLTLQWLGEYTISFLGVSGSLVHGGWSLYSVNDQGVANTIHLPFFVMLIVLFGLVISLLASGNTAKSSDSNI